MNSRAASGHVLRPGLPAALLLALAACGGGGGDNGTDAGSPAEATLSGYAFGGQSPLVGSAVAAYAVGSGLAAIQVATTTTDSTGKFNLAFTCSSPGLTPTSLVYVTATGGNPGGGNNSAVSLISALGQCQNLPATVNINELTTAAAAYALSGFLSTGATVRTEPSGTTTGVNVQASVSNGGGIANAFATAAVLADTVNGVTQPALAATATQTLNALANALAACVNTGGPSSSQCTELFQCSLARATFSSNACSGGTGTVGDTLSAALSVVHHPGTSAVAGVFNTATRNAVFSPTLSSAPNDWTLSLNFTGSGLNEPTQVAIDAAGNVWLANLLDVVSEFGPTGVPVSATGYTGGGLNESFSIAIDLSGNVWVTNQQSASNVNSGNGSITKLSSTGSILSGKAGFTGGGVFFPESVAIDGNGQVWIGNEGNSTVSALSSTGTAVSPAGGYTGGGLSFPVGIAVDGSGNVWLPDSGSNQVSEFSPAGVALSPSTGFTGGGLNVPQGLAIDQHGNVWVANYFGDSITELDSTGAPLQSTAFQGGGLDSPASVAIDGVGNVWITNYRGNTVTELAGALTPAPGAPLSPSTGFTAVGLNEPFSPAIDNAGNVWIGNFGNNSVTEIIGVAAPVKVPLIGLPAAP